MQLDFNTIRQTPPSTGNPIVFPLDNYIVEIVKEEGKAVNGSTDKGRLVLTLLVLDGPLKGQTYPYGFNLFNDNPTTVRIAYADLNAVMHVTGRVEIQDTAQLIGGRFIATIGPQAANEKYSEVKKVTDLQGNPAGSQQQAQPTAAFTPAQAQPGFGQPPAYTTPAAPQNGPQTPPANAWQQPASVPATPAPAAWANGSGASAAPPWAK